VKTDRVDGDGLLTALMHFTAGDAQAMRVVRAPSREQEDARQAHRELAALTSERTRYTNQLQGLLVTQGIVVAINDQFLVRLQAARDWAGERVGAGLQARLRRIWARRTLVATQIEALERALTQQIRRQRTASAVRIRTAQRLRGIGLRGSVTLERELFWRDFQNRRQLGGYLGMDGAPYQSGEQAHQQGISQHGNRHARRVLIPLAWGWLRYQPDSALSVWFQRRWAGRSDRERKVGIVAVARRLAIALWRWVTAGVVPDGARLKAA
jgi:transposase